MLDTGRVWSPRRRSWVNGSLRRCHGGTLVPPLWRPEGEMAQPGIGRYGNLPHVLVEKRDSSLVRGPGLTVAHSSQFLPGVPAGMPAWSVTSGSSSK